MTFIAGFRKEHRGIEYSVLIADSQETFGLKEKGLVQKIYTAGPYAALATGYTEDGSTLGRLVSINAGAFHARDLVETIASAISPVGDLTKIIISGPDPHRLGGIALYEQVLKRPKDSKGQGTKPQEQTRPVPYSILGSGATTLYKAIAPGQANFGAEYFEPKNPDSILATIAGAYYLATIAARNLTVDQNMQMALQIAGSNGPVTRAMFPPGIRPFNLNPDINRLRMFFGQEYGLARPFPSKEVEKEERWFNEFYRIFDDQMKQLARLQTEATYFLGKKRPNTTRPESVQDRISRIMRELHPFEKPLITGSMKDIQSAVKSYHRSFH